MVCFMFCFIFFFRLKACRILTPQSESEVAQLCPTLCDRMVCSLPGSSVHGIFQAKILEWVAISFSRGSSWPSDRTRVSLIAGRCFTLWATRETNPPTRDQIHTPCTGRPRSRQPGKSPRIIFKGCISLFRHFYIYPINRLLLEFRLFLVTVNFWLLEKCMSLVS